ALLLEMRRFPANRRTTVVSYFACFLCGSAPLREDFLTKRIHTQRRKSRQVTQSWIKTPPERRNTGSLFMKIISIFICCLLLLISASAATAQNEIALPNTAAGKQLKEWLRVFDSGNDQTFKKFIIDNYSKALLTENDADYRADRQAR